MRDPVVWFTFQKHSVFMPLKYLYPECTTLIEPYDQLFPLHCLQNDHCPANKSCMEILAKRINYFLTTVAPEAKQIIAYFKYRDRPNSIRAGVFSRDLSEPKVMIINPYAFRKFQKESLSFTWIPTDDFLFMSPSTGIIPVGNLIKHDK